MKKTIAYKVVGYEEYGTNITMYAESRKTLERSRYAALFEALEDMKNFRKFFPVYRKGTVVKSVIGSMGIFAFKNINDARDYSKSLICGSSDLFLVKRVEGIAYPYLHTRKFIWGCSAVDQFEKFEPFAKNCRSDGEVFPINYVDGMEIVLFKQVTVLD